MFNLFVYVIGVFYMIQKNILLIQQLPAFRQEETGCLDTHNHVLVSLRNKHTLYTTREEASMNWF